MDKGLCGAPCAVSTPTPAALAKPCESLSFSAGNYDVSYNGKTRCMSKVRNRSVPDGWYNSVRLVDGVIVEAQTVDEPVVQLQTACFGGGGSSGLAGLTVSADACNLTKQVDGKLLTQVFVDYGQYLSVTGCGTASNPLEIDVDFESIQSDALAGGLNYEGCGFRIENGLITAWVDPITSIQVADSEALSVATDGCDAVLKLQTQGGAVVYTRQGCVMDAGVQRLRASGQVLRNGAVGAIVQVFPATAADAAGLPTPPSAFSTIAAAVAWLDSNLPGCS